MQATQRRLSWILGILQLFVAVGAIPVGLLFVLYPSGGMGMDPSILVTGPFTDFLIPGLVLLGVNGLGSLVAAIATFRGHRLAPELAMVLGLFLMAWIVIQYLIIGFSWLQVLYFLIGLAELGLGWRLRQLRAAAGRSARPA